MYKKILFIFQIALFAVWFTACEVETGKEYEDINKIDLNSDHISMELTDKVSIDADITSYEVYKDGLNSYYGEKSFESAGTDILDSYRNAPTLYGKSIADQIDILRKYHIGDWEEHAGQSAAVEVDDDQQPGIFVKDKNNDEFTALMGYSEEGGVEAPEIKFPYEKVGEWQNARVEAFQITDLAALKGQKLSEQVREAMSDGRRLLEEMTNRKMDDSIICIPLEELGENNYAFCYFYSVDGLPWMLETEFIEFMKGVELSKTAKEREHINEGVSTVLNLFQQPQYVYYIDGAIQGISVSGYAECRDVFDEKEDVIDIKGLIQKLKDYYDKIETYEDIKITEIKLGYNGYITDGSDNKQVEEIVKPFWYVQYFSGTQGENMVLLFDAFTGKYINCQPYLG